MEREEVTKAEADWGRQRHGRTCHQPEVSYRPPVSQPIRDPRSSLSGTRENAARTHLAIKSEPRRAHQAFNSPAICRQRGRQDKPGGPFRATKGDNFRRDLRLPTAQGPTVVPVYGSKNASMISNYLNAVSEYLRTGKREKLDSFKGKTVKVDGKDIALITDPAMLLPLAEAGRTSFRSTLRIGNGARMSDHTTTRRPRSKPKKLRCVVCGTAADVELHHIGGRNHVIWIDPPLMCRMHHSSLTRKLQLAGIDMSFTPDLRERLARARMAAFWFPSGPWKDAPKTLNEKDTLGREKIILT